MEGLIIPCPYAILSKRVKQLRAIIFYSVFYTSMIYNPTYKT
jgi:hypothetical protein